MRWIALFACATLMGNVVYQPLTTPEFEEKLVFKLMDKPCTPLSDALADLIAGVSDQTFDSAFFDQIRLKEQEKYSGEFVDYWKNGQMKIKASFINGKVDGHVHGWFPDGNEAFKAFYYENLKVGVHMAFFPKGGPEVHRRAKARILRFDFSGKLDREQYSEYYGGELKSLIEFKHGLLEGKLNHYKETGGLDKACVYKNGELIDNSAMSTESKKN